jgi:hypothetical protein
MDASPDKKLSVSLCVFVRRFIPAAMLTASLILGCGMLLIVLWTGCRNAHTLDGLCCCTFIFTFIREHFPNHW